MKYETCPNIEELSAWTDNEAQHDYTEHCRKCDECREICDDFRKLNQSLELLVNAPKAEQNLLKQISFACDKPAVKSFDFIRNISKVAAILIVALLLSKFYNDDSSKNNLNPIAQSSALSESSFKTEAIIDGTPSTISSRDFILVGTDSVNNTGNSNQLNEVVEHAWVADNPTEIARLIRKIAPSASFLKENTDTLGNCQITVVLHDRELITLVNRLAEKGNALLSHNSPQPKDNKNVSVSGKKITYKAVISKTVK